MLVMLRLKLLCASRLKDASAVDQVTFGLLKALASTQGELRGRIAFLGTLFGKLRKRLTFIAALFGLQLRLIFGSRANVLKKRALSQKRGRDRSRLSERGSAEEPIFISRPSMPPRGEPASREESPPRREFPVWLVARILEEAGAEGRMLLSPEATLLRIPEDDAR